MLASKSVSFSFSQNSVRHRKVATCICSWSSTILSTAARRSLQATCWNPSTIVRLLFCVNVSHLRCSPLFAFVFFVFYAWFSSFFSSQKTLQPPRQFYCANIIWNHACGTCEWADVTWLSKQFIPCLYARSKLSSLPLLSTLGHPSLPLHETLQVWYVPAGYIRVYMYLLMWSLPCSLICAGYLSSYADISRACLSHTWQTYRSLMWCSLVPRP